MRLLYIYAAAFFIFVQPALAGQATGIPGPAEAPRLIELLGSEDGYIRSQASYALIGMGHDATPALIEALSAKKSLVEVIYVLNAVKDERAAPALARLLDTDDEEVRRRAESALFALGAPATPFLIDALKDPLRSRSAARALSLISLTKENKKLYEILGNPDPSIRASAASVLRSWRDPGATGPMGALLKDPDAIVRTEASGYFLALGPDAETPYLDLLLADTDENVRINALKIVLKTRKSDYFAVYCGILKNDTNAQARKLAAEALFRYDRDKSAPALMEALGDPEDLVASEAADYLGEMKAREAAPALLKFFDTGAKKPSDKIVESAVRALSNMDAQYDPELLLPYVNWENLYVVKVVLVAWETSSMPENAGIRAALARYADMPVDNRYKERVRKLLERLKAPLESP